MRECGLPDLNTNIFIKVLCVPNFTLSYPGISSHFARVNNFCFHFKSNINVNDFFYKSCSAPDFA